MTINTAGQRQCFTGSGAWEYEFPMPRGIVVAVDEKPESLGAFRLASDCSMARRWKLHAVSVIPSLEETGPLQRNNRAAELARLISAEGRGADCTGQVVVGRPMEAIAAAAECRGAEVIVVGLRQRSVVNRLVRSESALELMRVSSVPVLAVPRGNHRLQTAVVAIDFSDACVRAARLAARLMGGSGTMHLAYVDEPEEHIAGVPVRHPSRSQCDVVAWFRRMCADLAGSSQLTVEPTVLTGPPAETILEFADRVGAGLIVAGSHGHSRIEKFLMGSVSTALVRGATCPVLIAGDIL